MSGFVPCPSHAVTRPVAAPTLHVVVHGGLLTACAVVAGHALAALPNVELVTLVVTLAGAHLGRNGGLGVAAATVVYFNYLNPLGPAVPFVVMAQAAGWCLAALVGALAGLGERPPWQLAAAGACLTLVFDVLTNLAYAAVFGDGISAAAALVALGGGAPFMAAHVASNAVAFAVLAPPLAAVMARHRR